VDEEIGLKLRRRSRLPVFFQEKHSINIDMSIHLYKYMYVYFIFINISKKAELALSKIYEVGHQECLIIDEDIVSD
jgi:hypothetical protein